jgi:hypothetical protein
VPEHVTSLSFLTRVETAFGIVRKAHDIWKRRRMVRFAVAVVLALDCGSGDPLPHHGFEVGEGSLDGFADWLTHLPSFYCTLHNRTVKENCREQRLCQSQHVIEAYLTNRIDGSSANPAGRLRCHSERAIRGPSFRTLPDLALV